MVIETLDIAEAVKRREELMKRCEAGETFCISIDGIPKAKLEQIAAADTAGMVD